MQTQLQVADVAANANHHISQLMGLLGCLADAPATAVFFILVFQRRAEGTVTHPITNRAQRTTVTTFIETSWYRQLSHATVCM